MWTRVSLLAAAVLLAAGCGGSHHARPAPVVTPSDWRAVFSDWLEHGRVVGTHSCGSVVEAVAHARILEYMPTGNPTLGYRKAAFAFDRYAGTVCPQKADLSKIVVGMTDADVANVAGMPRTPRLKCWLYQATGKSDGRRVCFVNGRATLVQRSVTFGRVDG